jgi:hypothetical protein
VDASDEQRLKGDPVRFAILVKLVWSDGWAAQLVGSSQAVDAVWNVGGTAKAGSRLFA